MWEDLKAIRCLPLVYHAVRSAAAEFSQKEGIMKESQFSDIQRAVKVFSGIDRVAGTNQLDDLSKCATIQYSHSIPTKDTIRTVQSEPNNVRVKSIIDV